MASFIHASHIRTIRIFIGAVLLTAFWSALCCGDESSINVDNGSPDVVKSESATTGSYPLPISDLPAWGNLQPNSGDSPNRYPTFRLRGRIDTDFLAPEQSAKNQSTFGDLADVVGLRRARIGAEGNFTSQSRYVAEIDLASGNVVIRDLYVGLGDVHQGELKIGHMREPFSLEGGTSANSFAFMERSAINTLDPSRNWGVGVSRCGNDESWTFAGGIFQAGTDPSDLQYAAGSTTGFTGRWTGLPVYESRGERLVHIGLSVSERIPDHGLIVVNQQSRSPLLDLGDSTDSSFVPKLKFPAYFQQLINAQWAFVDGPLWGQAEWYGSIIDQTAGPLVFYHGGYADLGYFLTGEHRGYLKRTGVFGAVSVNRPVISCFSSNEHDKPLGMGAWELTGRISYLDFSNDNTPIAGQGSAGVVMPQTTIGLNWYLADRLRIMLNYTYSVPDNAGTGASSASVLGMRLAMFW